MIVRDYCNEVDASCSPEEKVSSLSCFHHAQKMIYNLYIFSRTGTCLFYTEWYRPFSSLRDLPDEDRKLMFGLLFSLKQLMNKASPAPCVVHAYAQQARHLLQAPVADATRPAPPPNPTRPRPAASPRPRRR